MKPKQISHDDMKKGLKKMFKLLQKKNCTIFSIRQNVHHDKNYQSYWSGRTIPGMKAPPTRELIIEYQLHDE